MKRIISIALVILLSINTSIIAFAEPETDTPIEPDIIEEYQYTSNLGNDLYISNKTASCQSSVYGFSGLATRVEITQTLQKKSGSSWNFYTSWVKNYYTWYGILTTTKSGLSSGTYRLKTVAKVYSGNNYETITVYSYTASC
ncbi:MAG: hypothetical protein IJM87_09435 [Ruminococcus sp.]|nr:hypothetical protein [Ruminococcus sp.]